MRKQDVNRKLFHTAHYNIIAKQIRQKYPRGGDLISTTVRTTLTDLVLSLANRFALDDENFKPEMFLDACSPDTELYPLSELWEGVDDSEVER